MEKLSKTQMRIIELYAKRCDVSVSELKSWVENGDCTITEITQWILGTPITKEEEEGLRARGKL